MEHAVALENDHLVLGRYRPLRPLGSGGSGSVWLVRDEDAGRDVALKIVPREGKAGTRAEREVDAATRLRHPGCLRALALHRDDGHVYVAYEYVPGKTLREARRCGALDDATAIEAATQVLEALAHAHGRGVVHRDVKPSNVMLKEDEEGISVRLLDFGLARLDEAETLTAAGDVPGTLAYIAPERLDGHHATGAADVWAVGVMLWEALAGRHPFAAVSPVETARRIAAGAPPLAGQRPDLPRELCTAVDRMLDLDPGGRPKAKTVVSALRLGADLRTQRPRALTSRTVLRERALHAGLAGAFAAGSATLLPFFPHGWPFLLVALVVATALASPRAGLAAALAVPVLPLGNLSLGLALAYGAVALAWLAFFARDPRAGLLFAAGPVLSLAGALPLAAVLALLARGTVRRAALAGSAVLASVAVAGLLHRSLPFTGGAPAGADVAGEDGPTAAFGELVGFLGAHPTLALEAIVLALAAATAALAIRRGLWGVAVWGSGFLVGTVALPALAGLDSVHALPLIGATWLATGLLGVSAGRTAR